MPEIQAVLFDFGGVLSHSGSFSAMRALDEQFHLEPGTVGRTMYRGEEWKRVSTGKITLDTYWERLAPRLDALGVHWDDLRRAVLAAHRPNEEVFALVRELQGRYRLAILSNATETLETTLAEKFECDGLFEAIFNSARLGLAKPDSTIYERAAELLGLPPAACVFIDDQAANAKAAEAVGMAGITFESAEQLRAEFVRLGLIAG